MARRLVLACFAVSCETAPGTSHGSSLAEQLNQPLRVIVDDDSAYVATLDGIVRVSLDGGAETLFVRTESNDEAMDDDALYVLSGDAIQRIPKDGGPSATLVTDGGVYSGIAVNSTNVFWSTRGALVYVSKSGGNVAALSSSTQADALVVDDDYAYWMTLDPIGDAGPRAGLDEYVVRAPGACQIFCVS